MADDSIINDSIMKLLFLICIASTATMLFLFLCLFVAIPLIFVFVFFMVSFAVVLSFLLLEIFLGKYLLNCCCKRFGPWLKPGYKRLFGYDYITEKNVFKGLKNSGDFCYMNAMIQALASSDQLIREFENLEKSNISNSKMNKLVSLLHDINDPERTADQNTYMLGVLMNEIKWEKTKQQDSVDLLSALINSIHNEIKTELSESQIQMPLKIKLLHIFHGITFMNKVQDHLGLSLGLFGDYSKPPGVRLEDLIKDHFTPTFIDDDPNQLTKMVFYKDVPEVLLLHIQANKWDEIRGEMYKPKYHIIYRKDLSMDVDIAMDDTNENMRHQSGIKYQLSAIVQHHGDIYGGHYITYRKWRGNWYLVSDEQVTKTELHRDVCPYVMIYEKIN